jgi:hypothetical protein
MSIVKEGQKSVRVVLPITLYNKVKKECRDHGDISKLVRKLLVKHFEALKEEHSDSEEDQEQKWA